MRIVSMAVGGGLLALIGLALGKWAFGAMAGLAMLIFGFIFKLALAVLAVWLGVRLLKSLVPPAKEQP